MSYTFPINLYLTYSQHINNQYQQLLIIKKCSIQNKENNINISFKEKITVVLWLEYCI